MLDYRHEENDSDSVGSIEEGMENFLSSYRYSNKLLKAFAASNREKVHKLLSEGMTIPERFMQDLDKEEVTFTEPNAPSLKVLVEKIYYLQCLLETVIERVKENDLSLPLSFYYLDEDTGDSDCWVVEDGEMSVTKTRVSDMGPDSSDDLCERTKTEEEQTDVAYPLSELFSLKNYADSVLIGACKNGFSVEALAFLKQVVAGVPLPALEYLQHEALEELESLFLKAKSPELFKGEDMELPPVSKEAYKEFTKGVEGAATSAFPPHPLDTEEGRAVLAAISVEEKARFALENDRIKDLINSLYSYRTLIPAETRDFVETVKATLPQEEGNSSASGAAAAAAYSFASVDSELHDDFAASSDDPVY
jgi:hypothetical protein